MMIDPDSGNFIGSGETASFNILKMLTGLHPRGLKHFPFVNGIYRQVPISWLIHKHDFDMLSDAHKKGSIDIVLKIDKKTIAVRIQGKGHGKGLKGIGKARHDKVQKDLLSNYISVVDVNIIECPNIFKDKINQKSINEIIYSFRTADVLIPSIKRE